ncbi:transposase [Kitasatospora sp. NPDC059973]|uniref:IS701 family transposase n=1 Tax=Kitasatospora sp. NPDC059973 TaxID=3347020 RepID=UPI0036A3B244
MSDLWVSLGGWSVAGCGWSGAVFVGPSIDRATAPQVVAAAGQLPQVISARVGEQWNLDLDDLFVTVGHRFGRVELRRRMRDYVRGLLAPVARKNSWQLAEQAGHTTPDGLQHLLAGAKWNPDDIRDDLQEYVADKLGESDGVLIIDDTGFIKKGITSAGVQRQYSGTAGRTENCQIGVFAAYATALGRALVVVGGSGSNRRE